MFMCFNYVFKIRLRPCVYFTLCFLNYSLIFGFLVFSIHLDGGIDEIQLH